MATHFLPKGVDPVRSLNPTIHRLAGSRSALGAFQALPDLTRDKTKVTCKLCLARLEKYPNRYL